MLDDIRPALVVRRKKKKKKSVYLVFINILEIIKGHLGLRDLLFLLELGESIV